MILTGELQEQRRRAFDRAAATIDMLVCDETNARHEEGFNCQEDCAYLNSRIGILVVALIDCDLWPMTELRDLSLDVVLKRMENNELRRIDNQESKLSTCGDECVEKSFWYVAAVLQNKVTVEAWRIRKVVKGLCYRCVRAGKMGATHCEHV